MTARGRRVLVLGGTGEAAALAEQLTERGYDAVLSLKGLTQPSETRPFPVRVGGFGGVAGLVEELRTDGYQLLVDASHPFVTTLAYHAAEAAAIAGIPRLRLLRPPWPPTAADRWDQVDSLAAAATTVERLAPRRVFLSVGRIGASAFGEIDDVEFVVRSFSATSDPLVRRGVVIHDRGPFTVESEMQLLRDHRIDLVVTRNSGGSATEAKLVAARRLERPVVMVRRPVQPPGDQVPTVSGALAWVEDRAGRPVP